MLSVALFYKNMENKAKTGRGHCAGRGSAMALVASDGGQDCCSRVSKARRGKYLLRGTGRAGMTKLSVAGHNRAKHGVGGVTNRNILIPTLFHLTLPL